MSLRVYVLKGPNIRAIGSSPALELEPHHAGAHTHAPHAIGAAMVACLNNLARLVTISQDVLRSIALHFKSF